MGLFKSCRVYKLLAIIFIGMPVSVLASSSVIEVQNVTGRTLLIAVVPTKTGSKHSEIYTDPQFPTKFYVLFNGGVRKILIPRQKLLRYDRTLWVVGVTLGSIGNALAFAKSLYKGKREPSVQAFEVGSAPKATIGEKSPGIFKVDTTGRLLAAAKALVESAKAAVSGGEIVVPEDDGQGYSPADYIDEGSLVSLLAPFNKATQTIKQKAQKLTEQVKKGVSAASQKLAARNNPQGWPDTKPIMSFDDACSILGLSAQQKEKLKKFADLPIAERLKFGDEVKEIALDKKEELEGDAKNRADLAQRRIAAYIARANYLKRQQLQ